MILFPPAKINLGLQVTNKRTDGFHDIETVFYAIPLFDALEINPSEELSFVSTGLPIAGKVENNLCIKAYELLKSHYSIPPVAIHLHKVIPMGAGLGGGSADAAYTLKLLKDFFELPISKEELVNFASQLGSDCPFFINDTPHFATGRGELLEPISFSLQSYKIILVYPAIHVNTAWAYQQIHPKPITQSIKEILNLPITDWKGRLVNDFEAAVFPSHPAIGSICTKLYEMGALYASMSGSGSAVFGIFEKSVLVNREYFDLLNYTYFCMD
jgi:4-diphosphocytidyl-2-C-methyl-D-erythritol kinase